MENENSLISLLSETENLMNDIILSGFHSIQNSSLERLNSLKDIYNQYGMVKGNKIIDNLINELNKRRNSFEYNINKISDDFCLLEFYVKNAKDRIE